MCDLLLSRRIRLLTMLSSVAAAQVCFAATITQFPTLPVQNSSFAIEDLDGDGKFDIILISATPNTGGVPVICEVIGGDGDALAAAFPTTRDKLTARLELESLLGDLESQGIIHGGGFRLDVHVLDGAANPPYSQELSPAHDGANTLWPRTIGTSCDQSKNPTVLVKEIDFTGKKSVVVGGANAFVYAFQTYGANLPGFPTATLFEFFNASTARNGLVRGETAPSTFPPEATTVDGSVAVHSADQSTFAYRHNYKGVMRQEQLTGDFVFSSVAHADAATPGATPGNGTQAADGVPDALTASDGQSSPPNQVHVWNDLGKTINPNNANDVEIRLGLGAYSSSMVAAAIDADNTQDVAILRPSGSTPTSGNPILQLFASNSGSPLTLELSLAGGTPKIGRVAYSTPAIANLSSDPTAAYDTIVVTSDGGVVYAVKYFNTVADCSPNPPPCLKSVWQSQVLDNGVSISASPLIVKLLDTDSGRPQVVVANDAGKIYVLKGSDGTVMDSFGPLGGSDPAQVAIYSTPAIWTRVIDPSRNPCQPDGALPTNCPILAAGNRYGTFYIQFDGYPPFNPDPANPATVINTQWPTFHRSNTRTGALVPSQDNSKPSDPVGTHNRGSIGGIADSSCQLRPVTVFEHDGVTPAVDYYTGGAASDAFLPGDNRFLFELMPARTVDNSYKVRFNDNSANDVDAPVDAGFWTRANHVGACAPPP